jgi:hypothetical protein
MLLIFTRLNFDVSNLTDIKARKTIATTAFYMYEGNNHSYYVLN